MSLLGVTNPYAAKIRLRQLEKEFFFSFFLNFEIFHIFLVKVLNITSFDQNRNLRTFYKIEIQN